MRSLIAFSMLLLSIASVSAQEKDIVDTAVSAGKFKTLVAAVKAADLVETLKGKGPFTVFAPTDEAFAKLPKSAIADLLKPENKAKLQSILTYHVVPGKVLAGDLLKVAEAGTVQGAKAKFGLTVEGANIVATDIKCSNGVIHVIDAVIMPPKKADQAKAHPSPKKMIQTAVANGSQLYNSGHACQCATLYTQTMKELSQNTSVPHQVRKHIDSTLQTAGQTHSSDERAWVLRRGLDSVYAQL